MSFLLRYTFLKDDFNPPFHKWTRNQFRTSKTCSVEWKRFWNILRKASHGDDVFINILSLMARIILVTGFKYPLIKRLLVEIKAPVIVLYFNNKLANVTWMIILRWFVSLCSRYVHTYNSKLLGSCACFPIDTPFSGIHHWIPRSKLRILFEHN